MSGTNSFRRVLNAGVDYVVNWLTQSPSPIYGSAPSFPTERARITVHSGRRVRHQSGELLVVMDGIWILEDPDNPARNAVQPMSGLIEFRLTALSPTRVELAATYSQPAVEPYFAQLLREINRLWGHAREATGESGQIAGGSMELASSRSQLFHELDEFLDDLLRYQSLVAQEEEAEEDERDWPPSLPLDPWKRPPEMDPLERKLIRRSVALREDVMALARIPQDDDGATLEGSWRSWRDAFGQSPGVLRGSLEDVIEQVKEALAVESRSYVAGSKDPPEKHHLRLTEAEQTGSQEREPSTEGVEAAMASMTERQREMVRLWRDGKTTTQIASHFGDIQGATVNKRISELRGKFGRHVVPKDAER